MVVSVLNLYFYAQFVEEVYSCREIYLEKGDMIW
jgi:hypothetical protein